MFTKFIIPEGFVVGEKCAGNSGGFHSGHYKKTSYLLCYIASENSSPNSMRHEFQTDAEVVQDQEMCTLFHLMKYFTSRVCVTFLLLS